MELCKDNKRDRPTLEEIILRRVKPGTHILTDGWAAYTNLPNLGVLNVCEIYSSVVMMLHTRLSKFAPCAGLRLFPVSVCCVYVKFLFKNIYIYIYIGLYLRLRLPMPFIMGVIIRKTSENLKF